MRLAPGGTLLHERFTLRNKGSTQDSSHRLVVSMSSASAVSERAIDPFLEETGFLDFSNRRIAAALKDLRGATQRETAVNIHDFVRDEVRFGWRPRFYAMPASQVLKTGVGYCNTKSTLFVAMLRGAGIPARQHFVSINTDILEPFVRLPQPYAAGASSETAGDHRTDQAVYERSTGGSHGRRGQRISQPTAMA